MVNCSICGRELTNEESVIRGIGPVCRNTILERNRFYNQKVCTYTLEFLEDQKICLIIEKPHPKGEPEISLTNCIEYVLQEIATGYNLCPSDWTFVQQSGRGSLFGDYTECDLVDTSGPALFWRYIWHSDAQKETKTYSRELIVDRVNKYRNGAKIVIE